MLRLTHRDLLIVLENYSHWGEPQESGDPKLLAALRFEHQVLLGIDDAASATSRHSVIVSSGGKPLAAMLLQADGGASGVHGHSAVVIDGQLYVAVGSYLVQLGLPDLAVGWSNKVDSATCFGVYDAPNHDLVLSHGEMEIAAVTPAGDTVWSTAGPDIFTGDFSVEQGVVRVEDFNDDKYVIDVATGEVQ